MVGASHVGRRNTHVAGSAARDAQQVGSQGRAGVGDVLRVGRLRRLSS